MALPRRLLNFHEQLSKEKIMHPMSCIGKEEACFYSLQNKAAYECPAVKTDVRRTGRTRRSGTQSFSEQRCKKPHDALCDSHRCPAFFVLFGDFLTDRPKAVKVLLDVADDAAAVENHCILKMQIKGTIVKIDAADLSHDIV